MVSPETLSKLNKWATKIGRTQEELLAEYQKVYNALPATLSEAQRDKMARNVIYSRIRGELLSKAEWFEGIVIGAIRPMDITAGLRRQAEQMYATNPQQAIAAGVVDANGVPLDTRKELAPGIDNPRYGKPLQPEWRRQVIGFFRKQGTETNFKFGVLTLRGDNVNMEIPYFTPVKFRANVREETDVRWILNDSRHLKFEASDVQIPTDPVELVKQVPYQASCKDLADWYNKNENDIFRFVAFSGTLLSLGNEPTEAGSYMAFVADESMEPDEPAVICFLDADKYAQIDYGIGTTVYIVGKPAMPGDSVLVDVATIVPDKETMVPKDFDVDAILQ